MKIEINIIINSPFSILNYSGGYSVGVPPLPIPNREVKPDSADGTASRGRVGSRQFLQKQVVVVLTIATCFLFILLITNLSLQRKAEDLDYKLQKTEKLL